MPGTLILCATPIGNLADAPPRLAEALAAADIVYAEDTRRSRVLLASLGVTRPLRSYFAGNEEARAAELAGHLEAGETVALVTDAGTPAVSDPGLSAVRAARRVGAAVTIVPGPSAVTAALAVSGLPGERFVFEGFLPRSGENRRRRLDAIAEEPRTVVLFAAPGRLGRDLADLGQHAGGDRSVVVCRELTKAFEEVWSGSLREAAARWQTEPARGEITLVLAGAPLPAPSLALAVRAAERLVGDGLSARDAARQAAEQHGVSRRAVYSALHEKSADHDE